MPGPRQNKIQAGKQTTKKQTICQTQPNASNNFMCGRRVLTAALCFVDRYLNNNKIMRLEPGCLNNLTALEQLKLNKNQMFELKKEIFKTLISLKFL